MDVLEAMAVFVEVAESGSFAAVAAARDLSPTMVANHVRGLEARLGERLIERTTRKHRLTEVGLAYLERCRDVLASAKAADQVGEALRSEPTGVLRVTAPVSYGAHRVAPLLGEYLTKFPRVEVELSLSDRVVDLVDEGFDVGIRSGTSADDSVVALPVLPSQMRVVASRSYLKHRRAPKRPEELEQHQCLAFAAWGPNHAWRFTRGPETVHVPVRGRLSCNNGQALLAAALAGVGVIVQADVLLDPVLEAGNLVRLLPDWSLPARSIFVVRRSDVRPSSKVRSFVDFLKRKLGASPGARLPAPK